MPKSVSEQRAGRRSLGLLAGLFGVVALLGLQGCATHSAGFVKIEQQVAARNLDGAIKDYEESTKFNLTSVDNTLIHLNRGTLLRLKGDFRKSNVEFDGAKKLMDELDAVSVTEQAASVAVNEGMKAYEGTPHEQLLIYAFKALNYLQAGDFDAAAVEARQFDIKHRLVMEKYPDAKYLSGAFVRYLNGMIYEAVGEPDSARIEFNKALEGYKLQQPVTGLPPPQALMADLARYDDVAPPRKPAARAEAEAPPPSMAAIVAEAARKGKAARRNAKAAAPVVLAPAAPAEPKTTAVDGPAPKASGRALEGEVVFFLHNGLGPTLGENRIQVPNPKAAKGSSLLAIAVPKFVGRPAPISRVELSSGAQTVSSEIVEDVVSLARKNLDDRMPAITARAVTRLLVKNAASAAAKAKAKDDKSAASTFLALAIDIGGAVSERADTRSWSLLPGNIQLARLPLAPGKYDLKAVFYGPQGGVVITREYKDVEVRKGERTFVADYYLQAPAPIAN